MPWNVNLATEQPRAEHESASLSSVPDAGGLKVYWSKTKPGARGDNKIAFFMVDMPTELNETDLIAAIEAAQLKGEDDGRTD